jgi:hypothetical protein
MIVPTQVFLHFLSLLGAMLDKVETFDRDIAANRLQPDMLPLLQQAKTAIGFTLRTCCPLAGRTIVSFTDDEYSFASVRRELRAAQDYLAAIPAADFAAIDTVRVDTRAGFADLNLSGWEYYLTYALPNFFFHYTTVYAIARQAGVALGKADFDGYHHYPAGFSFEAPSPT